MGQIFVAKFETLLDTSILVRKKSFSKICIAKKITIQVGRSPQICTVIMV